MFLHTHMLLQIPKNENVDIVAYENYPIVFSQNRECSCENLLLTLINSFKLFISNLIIRVYDMLQGD